MIFCNFNKYYLIVISYRKKGRSESSNSLHEDDDLQLSFFKLDDPVLEKIRDDINHLDINSLTPIEALNKLNEIKKLLLK